MEKIVQTSFLTSGGILLDTSKINFDCLVSDDRLLFCSPRMCEALNTGDIFFWLVFGLKLDTFCTNQLTNYFRWKLESVFTVTELV